MQHQYTRSEPLNAVDHNELYDVRERRKESVVNVDRTIVPELRNAIAERNLYAQQSGSLTTGI